MPGLIFHALFFIIAVLISYKTSKLPDLREYTVYFKVKTLGQWEIEEERITNSVEIEECELKELERRRAFLEIKKFFYIPESKRLEFFGNVYVNNNFIFIRTYGWEVEELPESKGIREYLMEKLKEKVNDEKLQAIALAFLFGESRRNLPLEVEKVFLSTGLIHVLVVSGLHVGLIFLILSKFFPKFYGVIFATFGVIFYTYFLVPHNPPAIRATIMLVLYSLSLLSFRRYCSLCALFFSGILILAYNPSFVFSYSFWLSFFAVLYILLALKDFEGNAYIKSFLVSLSAFCGVSPLIATFSYIVPLSVILNPLVSPLIFSYALFSMLSLLTLFYFPLTVLFMNFTGEIIYRFLSFVSNFSPAMVSDIGKEEAIFITVLGAIMLYFTKGYYKFVPLFGIFFYLLFKLPLQ